MPINRVWRFAAAAVLSGSLAACGGHVDVATGTVVPATTSGSSTSTAGSSNPTPAATLTLSNTQYSVTQGTASVLVTVNRTGGSSGAVSVSYATANSTASAGTDYTAASGTLNWANGDSAAKTFPIAISDAHPFSGSKTAKINLTAPSAGATLGTSAATVMITGNAAVASSGGSSSGGTSGGGTVSTPTGLALHVKGNKFVDAAGNVVQLRGANVSGLEFVAVQGWDAANPWGSTAGYEPNFSALRSWKLNSVRLPLNEASWLGMTTYDHTGAARAADPGKNYQATVIKAVNEAVAAGLYVILDLHWAAPNVMINGKLLPASPLTQNPMADEDHSLTFWTSVANTFKNNPAVVFELFNEPYFYWLSSGENPWAVLRDGGTVTQYLTGVSSPYSVTYSWKSAGMQSMLNAVRATGAKNVVLTSGVGWAGDISLWDLYKPTDPLNQLGAVWHAYPPQGAAWGTAAYSILTWVWGDAILAAGVPLVITETGDQDTPGTVGAPFVSNVLSWADSNGASVLGWGWNVWQNPDFVLIKDNAGTPTDGYGQVFHEWALNHK